MAKKIFNLPKILEFCEIEFLDDNFRNWCTQRHEPYLSHDTAPISQTRFDLCLKRALSEYIKTFRIGYQLPIETGTNRFRKFLSYRKFQKIFYEISLMKLIGKCLWTICMSSFEKFGQFFHFWFSSLSTATFSYEFHYLAILSDQRQSLQTQR